MDLLYFMCHWYLWWIYLGCSFKRKKEFTITNPFQNILDESKSGECKPNKIWIDKSSEIYNKSVKSWLQDSNIEIYSTHNKGKAITAEMFIKTLKNEIYKHMSVVSKDLYIDRQDHIVNKYKNTYHKTMKMKPIDVKYIYSLWFDK